MSKAKTSYAKTPTIKQRKFVHNLVKNDGNISRAAVDAGYSEKYASQAGNRLLKKKHIQDEIGNLLNKSGLSVDKLSKKLQSAVNRGLSDESKATVSDSLRGIEMALRLHGAFPDKKVQVEKRSVHLSVQGEDAGVLKNKLDELLQLAKGIGEREVIEGETTGQEEA